MTRRRHFLDQPGLTPADLVAQLAVPHRHTFALRRLLGLGPSVISHVRDGLLHDNAAVRVGCCKWLDHYMDDTALPMLLENLDHPDPNVRAWALHALACDKCKEGTCRPGETEVIPRVIEVLRTDPDRKVREMAAGMLGPSVHRNAGALAAIEDAHRNDADAVVRKICSWWIPGGTRFEKLRRVGSIQA